MTTEEQAPPIYISIDMEFTSPNLARGRPMQMGIYAQRVVEGKLNTYFSHPMYPLRAPAEGQLEVSEWVLENQKDLLQQSLVYGATTPLKHYSQPFTNQILSSVTSLLSCLAVPGGRHRPPLVLVTYCGRWDLGFLDTVLGSNDYDPFHYEVIEISSIALGLGYPWNTPAAKLYADFCVAAPTEHNAGEDARQQFRLFLELMHTAGHDMSLYGRES